MVSTAASCNFAISSVLSNLPPSMIYACIISTNWYSSLSLHPILSIFFCTIFLPAYSSSIFSANSVSPSLMADTISIRVCQSSYSEANKSISHLSPRQPNLSSRRLIISLSRYSPTSRLSHSSVLHSP